MKLSEPDSQTTDRDLVRVRPPLLEEGLLRNPAAGWMLYDDADGEVADAESYWAAMDQAARDHASIFYLRWRWSDAEPQEGRYAWLHDDNFKALIDGALSRGLRLAFRFYVNSRDNLRASTPDYVRQAGAQGSTQPGMDGQPLWTPYLDDPVFQDKLSAFLDAFAEEYDDPARVDFIDALGLGWWGEGHNLNLRDPDNAEPVYLWILDAYASRFQRVLLGIQYGTEFGWERDEQWAIGEHDFVVRRDGLGSHWFGDHQRQRIQQLFPRHAFFGERCYWKVDRDDPAEVARNDPRFGHRIQTWRDLDEVAIDDALEFHANTLDLRTIDNVQQFLTYPELIERFKRAGGYRLAPVEVRFPSVLTPGQAFTIDHAWANLGVGLLPNTNQRWRHKYRVAFALRPLDSSAPSPTPWIDRDAEPGHWIAGHEYKHQLTCPVANDVKPGPYWLACAILNTRDDGMPDLQLSTSLERRGPWSLLRRVEVAPNSA